MERIQILGVLAAYLCACELAEYSLVRNLGDEVFAPKLGAKLLRWVVLGGSIAEVIYLVRDKPPGQDRSLVLLYAFLFVVWVFWPRTVAIDSAGISSCGPFGLWRRSIIWSDVSRISSDWEERQLRFWTQMGTSITVTSREGACVTHGLSNRKQGAFLTALKRHLPREVFDPGLYDWNPDS